MCCFKVRNNKECLFVQEEEGIRDIGVIGVKMCVITIYFFFQAEGGIRDYKVTGVQTCALPIYLYVSQHYE